MSQALDVDPVSFDKQQSTPDVDEVRFEKQQSALSPVRMPRLLLVEDNKINLQMLHTYVRKQGFTDDMVSLATDGAQAVEAFKSQAQAKMAPDIILMDLSMPIMDGYEAARAIRRLETANKEPKRAMIVAVTGNTGGSDEMEALAAGMDVYLTKPVSFKKIGRLLVKWQET
jgi:CheY-like chemotaxis protein